MPGAKKSLNERSKRVLTELDQTADDATKQIWGVVEAFARWGRRTSQEIAESLNRMQARAARSAH
jgi:hypothetical protein